MRLPRVIVIALVGGTLPSSALAQVEVVTTGTKIVTCSEAKPKAKYGPRHRFDGILFSFIDGMLFTPCRPDAPCDARLEGDSLDVEGSQRIWEKMTGKGFGGWGWYRLTFDGRRGRWDDSRFCYSGTQDFYRIDRAVSVHRIANR
jgi:hypothetical protein